MQTGLFGVCEFVYVCVTGLLANTLVQILFPWVSPNYSCSVVRFEFQNRIHCRGLVNDSCHWHLWLEVHG